MEKTVHGRGPIGRSLADHDLGDGNCTPAAVIVLQIFDFGRTRKLRRNFGRDRKRHRAAANLGIDRNPSGFEQWLDDTGLRHANPAIG